MECQSTSPKQLSPGVLNGQPVMLRWLQLPDNLVQRHMHERLNDAAALQHPHIVPVIGGSLEQGGAMVYNLTQVCIYLFPVLALLISDGFIVGHNRDLISFITADICALLTVLTKLNLLETELCCKVPLGL